MYVGKNASAEWLPYKLGASFAYRLGRDKHRIILNIIKRART